MKVVSAPADRVALVSYLGDHLDEVKRSLADTGLLLFRGFDTEDLATLRKTLALFDAEPMTDARWSSPRKPVGEGAFTSTEYPAEQTIVLHSEMAYARLWPRLLAFHSLKAAETGGATTVADLFAVSEALGDVVDEFHEREVVYLRNFRKGIDIPWQHAFGTENPDEVEEIGRQHGLEVEWRADGTLRTTQQAQGAIHGPDGPIWFNQAHLFHPLQLPEATRKALVAALGAEGLPRTATFGDGDPIPDATIRRILDVLVEKTQSLDWQDGDFAIIDNMRWMHGRAPFTGTRRLLAAMGLPQSDATLTPIFG